MTQPLIRNLFFQLAIPIMSAMVLSGMLWYYLTLLSPPDSFRLAEVSTNLTAPPSVAFDKLPGTPWQPVNLPHDWRSLEPAQQEVWYRASTPEQLDAALFVPSINSYLTLWVDQKQIYEEQFEPSHSNNRWNLPRFISLGNLKKNQQLTLRVITDQPGYGLLGRAYIGSDKELRPHYNSWRRFHLTLLEYVTVAMLLVALLMGLIWSRRPQETVFGYAAAFMAVWFLHNLQLFAIDLPLQRSIIDWYAKLTLCWMVIFIIVFLHRLLDEKPRIFERILFTYGALSSLLTLLLAFQIPDTFWQFTSRYWDSLTLVMGIYPTVRIVRATALRNDKTIAFTAMAGTLIIALGGHDWFMVNVNIPRSQGYLIHYSAIVATVVFGAILIQRFVNAMSSAEDLNITLEQRVLKARKQIETQYTEMQALQQEQTLAQERERIMRDMHDGIGGHLVSCIAIVESQPHNTEAITDILRTSLLDLRLMIDSLEPSSKDILSMLAMLRERTEQQLKLVGILYHWKVKDLDTAIEYPPDTTLQLLRILQEAITNIVKHADAKVITVHTREETLPSATEASVIVEIIDDGKGFDTAQQYSGYGISNMQKRADRINAFIDIESSANGTCFRLTLPIETLKRQ